MVYAVGVDSGGTHSNLRRVGPDGDERPMREIAGSLSSNRADGELEDTLGRIFSAIRALLYDGPVHVWISCAGYSASTRDRFERLLAASMDASEASVGICNDAVGLLLAHDAGVVNIVAGTGSVVMARTTTGEIVSLGGDEWVAADYGSAFWIGLMGIRTAYRAMEGGPETGLLDSLTEQFEPDPGNDTRTKVKGIVRKLAGMGTQTKPRIASFAVHVTRQAELGDEIAQAIVKNAAEELAANAARVYRQLAVHGGPAAPAPRFVLTGAVAFRSSFYAEAFRASLNQSLFDVREATGERVHLAIQLNGTSEALTLARMLAGGREIPKIDGNAYSILRG
jgi:glucosamine kinase